MTRGMNTSTLLLSLAAVPALILTAEAENTPKALTDLQLPTGDNQAVGILIEPSFSKELITMHSEAIQKLSKLSEDKIQQFQKSYNADMPMPYMAEMWESEAAYQAYIAEWGKRNMQTSQTERVVISIKPLADKQWQLLTTAHNLRTGQAAPLSLCTLKYNPTNNTWVSAHGELTPSDFSADENYVFRAQKGTEWQLEKKDSFTHITQKLRMAKTTDGKALFISYISVERSQISGQLLSQQSYTLLFPLGEQDAGKR